MSRELGYTLLVEAGVCRSGAFSSWLFGGQALYSLYEHSNYEVYAALHAAGCPRLAFLLTDLDPCDPLDEEIASWKLWLVRAVSGLGGWRSRLRLWRGGRAVSSMPQRLGSC